MKQIAMGVVSFIIVVLFISVCLNINARYVREQDVINNLTEAVESSAKSVFLDDAIEVATNEELAILFMEAFVYQMESQDLVTIHVVQADIEKGILAVDLTQTFTYSSGEEGNVHYQKTVILDQMVEETVEKYELVFYRSEDDKKEGKMYKKYVLESGCDVKTPVSPIESTEEKREFVGWMDEVGSVYEVLEGVVEGNRCYVAVFE